MTSYARRLQAQHERPKRHMSLERWRIHLLYWVPISLVVLIVFITTGDLTYAATGGAEVYGEVMRSNIVRQISFLLLGGMGCALLLTRVEERQIDWRLVIPCCALLSYLFISSIWSDEPTTTLKRATLWACIVVAGFGLGKTWDFRMLSQSIFAITFFFLSVSILAECYYRAFLNGGEYRFSGIFHPGKQAFNCGLLFLSCLTIFLHERRRLFLIIGALAFGFLMLTKARTGTAATLLAGVFLFLPHLNTRWIVAIGTIGAWMSVGIILFASIAGRSVSIEALATMGRDNESADPTQLTGRWPIWNQTLEYAYERPFLGYGYGAFWTPQRYETYERRVGWALAHSHSAYIEALINVGLVGICIGFGIVAVVFFRSLYWSKHSQYADARLIASIIVLAMVSSFTEVAFISEGIEFIVIVTSIGSLAFTPRMSPIGFSRSREVFA